MTYARKEKETKNGCTVEADLSLLQFRTNNFTRLTKHSTTWQNIQIL